MPLTLEESTRRLSAYRGVEIALFEALGRWVSTVPEPEVKTTLAMHAREHAWHAELWHERLPTTGWATGEAAAAAAGQERSSIATALLAPAGQDHTIEKLVGAYRVLLPRAISAYSQHLRASSEITDGPVIRALRLVLRDEVEGWCRGEELLQSLLGTEEQVRRAAEHQARLEWVVTEAGGVTGGPPGGGNGHLDSGGKV